LDQKPRAWEDFVDRFMGLVVHVVNHSTQTRSVTLLPDDRDDLCSEVFLSLVKDDFAILRHFRGQSSLATYLTVIARRIVVRSLMRKSRSGLAYGKTRQAVDVADARANPEKRVSDREEVERLLEGLNGREAEIVRMYHLESKTYKEISAAVGVPANSVGPILSRARDKMRRGQLNQPTP
jgi:RNA polymerase sigma-70 factor (ECF subfamily)